MYNILEMAKLFLLPKYPRLINVFLFWGFQQNAGFFPTTSANLLPNMYKSKRRLSTSTAPTMSITNSKHYVYVLQTQEIDERPTSKMEPLLMCTIFTNVCDRARRMAATCVYTRYMFVSRYFLKSKRGSKKVPQCPARPLHGKSFVPPEIPCCTPEAPPEFQPLCKYGCMKCINIIKSLPLSI